MIVGIDIHGVIDTYPNAFQKFAKSIIARNDTVYIITGPPKVQAIAELEALGFVQGIHYHKVISVVDWLKAHLEEDMMWTDEKNNWWCNESDWWCSKARICNEFNVQIHFDDSEKYLIGWDATNCKTEFYLVKEGKNEIAERKR